MMELAERKRLAVYHLRKAITDHSLRSLHAASLYVLPHRHDILKPYALLVCCIERRWKVEQARQTAAMCAAYNRPNVFGLSVRCRVALGVAHRFEQMDYEHRNDWKKKKGLEYYKENGEYLDYRRKTDAAPTDEVLEDWLTAQEQI